MAQYSIAVVVGSLRRDSFNRKLASALGKLAPADFSFNQVRIDDLPLYNQDDDASQAASVKRLKTEVAGSQGLLFFTPEYNRSMPGVLKNAIDHASRPYGQNAWRGKPAGVIGVSVGAIGTAMAQQHLRNVLSYLDVPAGSAGGIHPGQGRPVRRGRQHRRGQQEVHAAVDGYLRGVGEKTQRLTRPFPPDIRS
jgi:chromate reductase